MQKANKKWKLKLNKKIAIIIIAIILLASCIITITTQIVRQIRIKQLEDKPLIDYIVKEELEDEEYQIIITITNTKGIETIKYISQETENEIELRCNGKMTIGIDYVVKDKTDYKFKIKIKDEEEKEETMHFEVPRIKGNYTLVDGLYVNEPDISGFAKENTRYIYKDEHENLVPGEWLTGNKPSKWYNYKNRDWANIYSEINGIESYYVWIPRYVYKKDDKNSQTGNERMDIKFINTDNEYIEGETGKKLSWEDLKKQGYKLPEAFKWQNNREEPLIIPGYWMSKYQLSELKGYKLNYNLNATKESFKVSNFTNNLTDVAKYTYAINGVIVNNSETLEEYLFNNTTPNEMNVINITALDANGSILASMTKKFEPTEANEPDLTGFDEDTTFYVYWDEKGIEHNEIPISQDPPQDWYNYSYAEWANIVTRNNGMESYYVWIPRYQYSLDQVSQRSNVQFILGTETETRTGYKIPEAFTWGDNGEQQLKGYWLSKYQLSTEEVTARITADISAGSNVIRVGPITGTALTKMNEQGEPTEVSLNYKYYLNGKEMYSGTRSDEEYSYTDLDPNTTYTINIIARDATTDEYVGAITKKIKTIEPYAPDLTGFDEENTYYVVYREDGTTEEKPISEEMPDNWYDYSARKWANIVTKANNTKSYFVWIPRYEYRILSDRTNESLANKRTEVNFITTETTNDNCTKGYQVPEAFTWGDEGEKQIKGYWMSKYQLSE